jgi:AraC-like DNA-binding protein
MPRVIPFKIPKSNKEFVRFQVDSARYFYDKLHQHPQWQLTVIVEGKGQLFVGDYIGRFEPGDIYLFSANLPHVFRSDAEYYDVQSPNKSLGLTLFFDFEALGLIFSELEEFSGLYHWVQRTRGCYKLTGSLKVRIQEIFINMETQMGLERMITSLGILQLLQQSSQLILLNKMISLKDFSETEGKRMGQVMAYILSNSQGKLTLQDVAAVANLSKEAFCRFFKERTGKTFTEFVSQIRIHQACQLLQDTDHSISEIAFQCGFQNMSYFNRAFKKFQGETPKEFRRMIKEI